MSKGGPTFSSGNNSLTIGGIVQFRWTGDSASSSTPMQQSDDDAFRFGVNDGFRSSSPSRG